MKISELFVKNINIARGLSETIRLNLTMAHSKETHPGKQMEGRLRFGYTPLFARFQVF